MDANLLNGKKVEKEKNWPQVVAILTGALSGFNVGLLFAWCSPYLIKITEDKINYNITEDEASYMTVIQPLSMIFSCPIFSTLTDVIGRKPTLMLIVIPHIGSWLCSGFAKSLWVFYMSRVCAGFADGCLFATLPTYVGEVANPKVRGTWGNAVSFSLYLGEFSITAIGSYVTVTQSSYIGIPLCLLFFTVFYFMPESPYYYIQKGQEESAKKSLRFLKGKTNVEDDYIALKKDVDRQLSESASWIDVVKIRSNRKAILAGIFIRFTQQTAGLNVFYVYTQYIFKQGGGNVSHEHASMLMLGISLILNFIALTCIVKRFGRKMCYMWSLVGTGIILYIMGIYYYLNTKTTIDLSSFKWMPITTMLIYQLFASFGVATIPTLMLSELFSASVKAKAMAILTMTFGLGNFFNNFVFYELNSRIGFYFPFFFFAICNTIAAVMSYFVVPETKDKTLEEIQQELKGKKRQKK